MSGADLTNFLESIAKHVIIKNIDENINKELICQVWLEQKLLFISKDNPKYYSALEELNNDGIPLETIEQITGLSKSNYQSQDKADII